jgi:hypothetical protein
VSGPLSRGPGSTRRRLSAAAVAVPIVFGVCWVLAPYNHHAAPEPSRTAPAPVATAHETAHANTLDERATLPARTLEPRELARARERPEAQDVGHPHPLSAAHQRIFAENARVAELNSAMDRGDYAALRELDARYREAYPEDEHALQQGYELIADCMERLTPARVDAARRFWRERRASSLRRYVRRYCLQDPPAFR